MWTIINKPKPAKWDSKTKKLTNWDSLGKIESKLKKDAVSILSQLEHPLGITNHICFFTEINCKKNMSIEHFIEKGEFPQHTFNWNNLFLSDKNWNSKKKSVVKLEDDYIDLLENYVVKSDFIFEYYNNSSFKEITMVANSNLEDGQKDKINLLINKLHLNDFKDSNTQTLAKVRWSYFKKFEYCLDQINLISELQFPSMFYYFQNNK